MQEVSFVVPVYNEESNLQEFYKRITQVMAGETYDYRIIFIDDGSSDSTAFIIKQLAEKDSKVEAFLLSRNYGHQMALTCGLDNADGDAVITMDGDLQHPPELVPKMLRLWEAGNQIVKTIRKKTSDASFFKNITSSLYYKVLNMLTRDKVTAGGSDFRLMDRQAVEAFRLYRERARFIRGMVNILGFKVAELEFEAPARFAGKSKFTFHKMFSFAMDGVTAFSNLPLRWAFYAGLLFGFLSLAEIIHVLFIKFVFGTAVPGWATIVASVLFLGGIQLIGIGILGEYIGRIFEEVKHRPLYLVMKHIKNDDNDDKLDY